jgi:hypothetical protein
MQQILANQEPREEQSEERIQHRQEHACGGHGIEVVVAFLQRPPEVVQPDRSDSNLGGSDLYIPE